MTRADLQWLARQRLREAKALLAAKCWSGAYYLAGYAVECGLKSCIIKYLMATDEFPERRFSEQCWTHNLTQLVRLAGLEGELQAALSADPDLKKSWEFAKDWEESSRYNRITKRMAVDLFGAIAAKKHGVIRWIRKHW